MAVRRRATKPQPKQQSLAERIGAERDALGMGENQEISELLAEYDAAPSHRVLRNRRIETVSPERGDLTKRINELQRQDVADAGFLKHTTKPRPQIGRTTIGQTSRGAPGDDVLSGHLKASVEQAKGMLSRKETHSGQKFFSGGGAGVKTIDDALSKVAGAKGTTRTKLDPTDVGSKFAAAFNQAEQTRGDLASKQNFRSGIVAESARAQRAVQQVNNSIFTGRKRRTGSSVAIPRAFLSGIAKSTASLLGGS